MTATEYRIVIVGAGPSGYFVAQALQNAQNEKLKFVIDMIEKLPTPWGLVRSGVAPDHPRIKNVSNVFEEIAKTEGFQIFCNVELGKDVNLDELEENYDAVVIATGADRGHRLGIPGEALPGSFSAAEFVPWYNGHPDFANLNVDLSCRDAVVIGAGNVAMDVGRMLAVKPSVLDSTDISDSALAKFHSSSIQNIHICGRRGPEHATFTFPELREILKLDETNLLINQETIQGCKERIIKFDDVTKDLRSRIETMLEVSKVAIKEDFRTIHLHFFLSPIEILGENRVEGIVFAINELINGRIVPTEKKVSMKCGLVISAIGYESKEINGLKYENGRVLNIDGRVIGRNTYVVGWAKRGASGVIGANKSDSVSVAKLIVEDLKIPKQRLSLNDLLANKGVSYISQEQWELLNQSEIYAGKSQGRPRIKFINKKDMLDLLF